jgi:peptidoglycan/LPS O-acetylase OafA/YrhL
MRYLHSIFQLRRITSSGKYIPEIDGLRFIAIASVVLYHLNGFWVAKTQELYQQSGHLITGLNAVLSTGNVGVELFFVISGYILGLPFANKYLGDRKDVPLGSYFKRRLTRLEPPYIVMLLLVFCLLVFVVHKYTAAQLVPSLLASLTYTHNFFYGRDTLPLITSVAWSLEIEVQFYLLAPLLARVFLLPAAKRRTILLAVSLALIVLPNFYLLPFRSIVDYAQFFLIGFLFADLKITNDTININKWLVAIIGTISFVTIFYVNGYPLPHDNIYLNGVIFLAILVFNYMCLFHGFLKGFLANTVIATIGGMCYSIYLLHQTIIAIVANKFIQYKLPGSYYLHLALFYLLLLAFIFTISSIYYMLIERPCMRKNWPQLLVESLKRKQQRMLYILNFNKRPR